MVIATDWCCNKLISQVWDKMKHSILSSINDAVKYSCMYSSGATPSGTNEEISSNCKRHYTHRDCQDVWIRGISWTVKLNCPIGTRRFGIKCMTGAIGSRCCMFKHLLQPPKCLLLLSLELFTSQVTHWL